MRCPICRQETFAQGNPLLPFCSERCKLIDLDNWLAGRYYISTSADKVERVKSAVSCKAPGETESQTHESGE
jgi:endogenous inhibitor of DNA gyrase (YacG/DUF329 family)